MAAAVMARVAKELGPLAVSRLTAPGLHAVGGVAGLYLQVLPPRPDPDDPEKQVPGGRSWILRATVGGRRRDMGLGGFPTVTLAGARERAREARDKINDGLDPIKVRRDALHALRVAEVKTLTFKDAARDYMAAHEDGWRNAKHREQWRNTLAEAYPHIGEMRPHEVDVRHILDVLQPIWKTRTETASRLRQRIEAVLSYCKSLDAKGNAEAFPQHWQNPARWKDHLQHLLTAPSKIKEAGHMKALPVGEVGAFMLRLRDVGGMGARALAFAVLTAARSGEVRGATWAEIDLKAKVWTIPGSRMKAGKQHRVPLSSAAVDLLEKLPRIAGSELVFPSTKGTPLSDRTLLAVLRRMDVDATVHGFRSAFRDWCGNFTNFPREVAEAALAHAIRDETERAYRRDDALEKRRKLMEAWAGFCSRPQASATVTPFRGQA